MSIVGATLGLVLGIFQLILLARVVLDWAVLLAGSPSPGSAREKFTPVIYRITEPVLAPVRKLVPPLRIGGVGLDLAFIIVFIAVIVLRMVVSRL
jgi:YggT family protein